VIGDMPVRELLGGLVSTAVACAVVAGICWAVWMIFCGPDGC
jgi:hypothetical protein